MSRPGTLANTLIEQLFELAAASRVNYLVAGTDHSGEALASGDGLFWRPQRYSTDTPAGSVAAWNDDYWLIGTESSGLFKSADGVRWTAIADSPSATSLCWNGSVWVAGGVNTPFGVATSPDGETWTGRASIADDLDGVVTAVGWNGQLFVMLTHNGSTLVLATSPNGITWTTRTIPTVSPGDGYKDLVATNGTIWVVGGIDSGADTMLLTSTNGITWTAQETPVDDTDLGVTAICWAEDRFYATVSTSPVTLIQSTDGITWEAVDGFAPSNAFGLCWDGHQLLTVSSSIVLTFDPEAGASYPATTLGSDQPGAAPVSAERPGIIPPTTRARL